MRFLYLPVLALLCLGLGGSAPAPAAGPTPPAPDTADLRQDSLFFQRQARLYQRWLDEAGFGEYLRFREIGLSADRLDLFLEFRNPDLDWGVSAWWAMKDTYERNAPYTLEEGLFFRALSLMNVPPEALTVQLYDDASYRNTNSPIRLFQRAIHFAEGRVQAESSDPKSSVNEIDIRPRNIDGDAGLVVAEFRAKHARKKIFNCILAYARARYGTTDCKQRDPRVVHDDSYADRLVFSVVDLCQEVLPANNSLLCSWLRGFGYECNWAKRELLLFIITHEETLDGIRLTVEIEGKIASGFHADTPRDGYLSMDLDWEDELEAYGERFARQLRQSLDACR